MKSSTPGLHGYVRHMDKIQDYHQNASVVIRMVALTQSYRFLCFWLSIYNQCRQSFPFTFIVCTLKFNIRTHDIFEGLLRPVQCSTLQLIRRSSATRFAHKGKFNGMRKIISMKTTAEWCKNRNATHKKHVKAI